jgi:hypothetical protein
MQFEDRTDGDYRIHAGSLETHAGQGHLAAVVVSQLSGGKTDTREIYRDTAISGGHRWLTSREALQRALSIGARAVKVERARAAGRAACLAQPANGVVHVIDTVLVPGLR